MHNETCPESIIRNNKAMIQKSLYNLFAFYIKRFFEYFNYIMSILLII